MWFVENNTHAMTLVDPCVFCEKNTHAMTFVDPYVVYGKEHTCNDIGGSMCCLWKGTHMQCHWLIHVWFVKRTHMQCHWLIHVLCEKNTHAMPLVDPCVFCGK